MIGRKRYAHEQSETGHAATERQLSTHKALARVVGAKNPGKKAQAAPSAFAVNAFISVALVLDRPKRHRRQLVKGKGGNPLSQVETSCDPVVNKGTFPRVTTSSGGSLTSRS